MRPDMRANKIQKPPTREDLGLENDPSEPFPGPVGGFAPWLTAEPLATLARRRKAIAETERREEETRAFLCDRVTTALEASLAFLAPLSRPISHSTASVLLDATIRIYTPMLLETLDELYHAARSHFLIMLKRVINRLLETVTDGTDEILRTATLWIVGMVVDDTLYNTAHAFDSDRSNVSAQELYELVLDLSHGTSTADLVLQSVNMQHFTLSLEF
jgi:hypothetical protein